MDPRPFWLVGYAGLVWDRSILGFVPISFVTGTDPRVLVSAEFLNRFRFFEEAEADALISELSSLEISGAFKKCYGNPKRVD